MPVARYREKAVQALQWTGKNLAEFQAALPAFWAVTVQGQTLRIRDKQAINVGDWIVRDFGGDVAILPDDLFKNRYELA